MAELQLQRAVKRTPLARCNRKVAFAIRASHIAPKMTSLLALSSQKEHMLRKLLHVEEAKGWAFRRCPSGSGAKSRAALLHSSFLKAARC